SWSDAGDVRRRPPEEICMATFVLVHGAWHGGWCWRDTAKALRAAGHEVHAPTHTGVGQRAHLSSEAITLETHVRDVVGCIEAEELNDVILCGHSYGGMVITAVADRLGDRIRALSYLDAFVPAHGDSLKGGTNPAVKRQYILADGWDPSPFRYFAQQCSGQRGWDVVKMPCGHDVMVDMPDELARQLIQLA